MTYRSGNVEWAAGVSPIPAEAVALQRLSALCHVPQADNPCILNKKCQILHYRA